MTDATAIIYRDQWRSNKWRCDLHFDDGVIWPAWQSGFRTKTRLIEAIRCTFEGKIERGEDV